VESSSLSPLASAVPAAALLFPFPFSFSFSFVVSSAFSFLHYVSTVPQSITVVLLFPFPFPFSFSFVWAALHCSLCM
jgi:hypothetical protein